MGRVRLTLSQIYRHALRNEVIVPLPPQETSSIDVVLDFRRVQQRAYTSVVLPEPFSPKKA